MLTSGLSGGFFVQNSLYFFDSSDAQAGSRSFFGCQGLGWISELVQNFHGYHGMDDTVWYHGSVLVWDWITLWITAVSEKRGALDCWSHLVWTPRWPIGFAQRPPVMMRTQPENHDGVRLYINILHSFTFTIYRCVDYNPWYSYSGVRTRRYRARPTSSSVLEIHPGRRDGKGPFYRWFTC